MRCEHQEPSFYSFAGAGQNNDWCVPTIHVIGFSSKMSDLVATAGFECWPPCQTMDFLNVTLLGNMVKNNFFCL